MALNSERARIGFSARIEQLIERKIDGFRHPLPVFLKGRDVVFPQIGLLQQVLIVQIEERPGRNVQFQLAQWVRARGGLQSLRHRPLRVDQVTRRISAKRRAWRDARVVDEIARDRADLGVANARLAEERDPRIVRRRRGLKKSFSQLPVRQSKRRNDQGHRRHSECRCSSFQRCTVPRWPRQRQQWHAGELGNAEYQEAEK